MAKYIRQNNRIKNVRTPGKTKMLSARTKLKMLSRTRTAIKGRSTESRRDDTPSGYAGQKVTDASKETGYQAIRTINRTIKSRPESAEKYFKTKEYVRQTDKRQRRNKTASDIAAHRKIIEPANPQPNQTAFAKSGQANIETKSLKIKSGQNTKGAATSVPPASHGSKAQTAARGKAMRDAGASQMAQQAKKKTATRTAKRSKEALKRMLKAAVASFRSLLAALIAGGALAIFILVFIIMIGAVVASPIGIFFSNDSSGSGGMSMRSAVELLNTEFSAKVLKIEDDNAHDELEIISDGEYIDWKEVIAVYACKLAGNTDDPVEVVTVDEQRLTILREIMYDMNRIGFEVKIVTKDRTVVTTDEEGNEVQETESVTISVLVITISHKSADQMAAEYSFTQSQKDSLAELINPVNGDLWAELIGGQSAGSGTGTPSNGRISTGIFSWPLEVPGTITSWFGYRKDPITGVVKYHNGTDIAVPTGTPILAAADGTVTIANSIDSYGGGWGYYVKINHDQTFDTLYAHCSSLVVKKGDIVKKGQIIAYVGTTGRSTGPHLHFEVYENGQRTNALKYFK